MGWFDQFMTADQPGGGGLPPSGPPPDDSPDWYWDGSAWTKLETPNPWPQQPGGPNGPPPVTTPGTSTPYPTAPPPTAAAPGAPAGWDATKWANQAHQTDKYKAGRILAKYPPTAEGLKQAIPELQAAYPGLTFNGKDTIEIPGLGPIDVLQNAAGGGVAWQWIDKNWEAKNGGNMGVPPVAPVAPYQGAGGGFGGGGGSTGGGTPTDWSMPKGSDYQFGGVPGYSGGYQSSAFSVPPSSTVGGGVGAGSAATGIGGFNPMGGPTGVMSTGMPTTTGAPAYQSSAFNVGGTVGAESPLTATTTGGAKLSAGEFGSGLIPNSQPIPKSPLGMTPSYDRAPSFTPLDPFKSPDSPGPYKEWQSTAFDVGPAPDKFVLPTGQAALEQDPGYQFRIDQGLKSLEQSAAAKGMLRTGGSLKNIQDFGQRAASQEYQNAVDRALAAAGFNEGTRRSQLDLGLRANDQNNRYGLAGSQFNAGERQQDYTNRYTAANQGYAYANQQNMAGNNQALQGYQTDVGRDLGMRGLKLTESQNNFMNSLNGQQQQWMQVFMQNGQSFDQAYKMMMAGLQYPT